MSYSDDPRWRDAQERYVESVARTRAMERLAAENPERYFALYQEELATRTAPLPTEPVGATDYAASGALASSIAARAKWSSLTGAQRTEATAAARASFDQRWEKLVDPDGTLAAEVRAERAAEAKRAHYARLAEKSAEVRRAKAAARKAADDA